MILQGSPSHWPISNRKVALIFLKLNSGTKNKTSIETKILKKMPCRRPKQWNLAEKQWTSYEVLSVDPFPIEKLHQFKRNWILAQKKRELKQKFVKNAISETETIEFGRKMKILQRSPSHWPISNRKVALICLKLNSCVKKKTTTETKILKKMPFRKPKRWNLAEKRWTSYGVLSVDPFPSEKFHYFKQNWILAQKKNEHRNEKF